MFLIESSRDLLNIVIAFCLLWLTIFLTWLIYYLAMITRQAFKITKEMRQRINKIDELIGQLKEKIEHSTSYLLLIGEGVKKLAEVMKDKGKSKNKSKND